jgi:hypothetical protein
LVFLPYFNKSFFFASGPGAKPPGNKMGGREIPN